MNRRNRAYILGTLPRVLKMMREHILAAKPLYKVAVAICLVGTLSGCASQQATPGVAYSLEGPPLAIAGVFDGTEITGIMDRKSMVGVGKIHIESADPYRPLVCEARLNTPPTEKGRIRGVFDCSKGLLLFFTLRNLGPDQGVGIARPLEGTKTLVFFYHSWDKEAKRRLPEVLKDLSAAQSQAEADS